MKETEAQSGNNLLKILGLMSGRTKPTSQVSPGSWSYWCSYEHKLVKAPLIFSSLHPQVNTVSTTVLDFLETLVFLFCYLFCVTNNSKA